MAKLKSNSTLSHYRIVSKIGAGGMGEVYLAEDTKLKRGVAIKLLPESLMADEQARMRLVREAQAVAKLDHPNICSVYEVGEEDGRTFIVMQYVEGETLDIRLKTSVRMYGLFLLWPSSKSSGNITSHVVSELVRRQRLNLPE